MTETAPIAVVIPTFNRGELVFSTIERVLHCEPPPTEIWVHVDKSDGMLEEQLKKAFPSVQILSSVERNGPGWGRHLCLQNCTTPFAVSFDDDSYPMDSDFFACVLASFLSHPETAVINASIWQRNEPPRARSSTFVPKSSFTGCGHAIRLSAYQQVRGYISRPVNYGMEETDLSIQMFAAGWRIYESGELRVFHDTDLAHHSHPEILAGTVANTALFAFLHYPFAFWAWGVMQLINLVWFNIRRRRWYGLLTGLAMVPNVCYSFRIYRRPLPCKVVWSFLKMRRTGDVV